ncbi:pumilio domain-containing protein, partial [Trifolium medium]|nr:pumilio domain-containing protein [Trifolium medium]
MNNHGTRVVQIMVENMICPYTKYAFVNIMKRITVALMKNVNGNYVIEKCVKLFPPELQIIILDEIAINCVDIATDKIGTSAIQKCLRHGNIFALALLVTEISSNAMVLAEDPYG